MCGIVGYVGATRAVDVLVPALKRLEYRGYDSAGVATVNGHGLEVHKAAGRIRNLEALLARETPQGTIGIAHTRWATHGRPNTVNSHPHPDCHGRLAVVHNGIIENHAALRDALEAEGHSFKSQTDTEVIAHLIERHRTGTLLDAVCAAARQLEGSYAIACISQDAPDLLVAVRGGCSPLVIGVGEDGTLLASDVPALLGRSRDVLVLEDGEAAALTRSGATLQRLDGRPVHRSPTPMPLDVAAAERGGYAHFMLKEIYEQPDVVRRTLAERLTARGGGVHVSGMDLGDDELRAVTRVRFLACGTSWHAAMVGKYLIEELARVPVDAEIASELRHREPLFDAGVLAVPVSQSGETADTLAAVRTAREHGARVLAVANVVGSSIAREADRVIYTRAGLEVGVAATKTFVAQVAAVTLLAVRMGEARGTANPATLAAIARGLEAMPRLMEEALALDDRIRGIAARLADRRGFLYLGRGVHYPLALEGALKLKEIAYVHAEAYPAGEMKHGPIALVDAHTPVIAVAPAGPTSASMASNMQEVKARDGLVVAIVTDGDTRHRQIADIEIPIPDAPYWVQPLLAAVPLQLLAYHLAVLRGTEIDQPRNLAKSVTVE